MARSFFYKGLEYYINNGRAYCLEPCFLDIETSNNHAEDPHELRTWIVSIQVLFNGEYHLFRYPEELIQFYKDIYDKYDLYDNGVMDKVLITYIHNASYDLSYLLPYLFDLPDFEKGNKGIVEGKNKILTFVRGALEFRCSYRLSGVSLEKWSKEMNIEHKKLVGLYDYDATLYQDSILSKDSEDYDLYDVLSMFECSEKQLNFHGDNLATVPYTATGYIRRTLRRSCNRDRYYRNTYFYKNRLNYDCFEYCIKSYAGGVTHNNRFFKNRLIQCNKTYKYHGDHIIEVNKIRHRDFKSHYPSQMTCNVFPLGEPHLIYNSVKMDFDLSIEDILNWYPEFTSFAVIRFYGAKLKDEFNSMPFLQFSKCYETHFTDKELDNGRILNANGEWIMYLDNITLSILNEQYYIDYEILEVYRMKNERLPQCIIDVIDYYFKGKSDKKNLVHDLTFKLGRLAPETIEEEFNLLQMKKGLNAIYGCTATSPLKQTYEITDLCEFKLSKMYASKEEIEAGLYKYYHGKNNFLAYQIGCMVTAYARLELYEYIKTIGYDKCLYIDTDSCFYISTPEVEKRIEDLNAEKRKKAHYVTLDNGKKEYYDEFCLEPDIIAFKGLHSKCYGIVTDKGLEVTIAGVPARTIIGMNGKGPIYFSREDELSIIDKISSKEQLLKKMKDKKLKIEKDPIKALDHLEYGFKFHVNTGINAIYIGATGFNSPRVKTVLNIEDHEIHTAGGCVIRRLKEKEVKDIDINCKNDPNIDECIEIEMFQ